MLHVCKVKHINNNRSMEHIAILCVASHAACFVYVMNLCVRYLCSYLHACIQRGSDHFCRKRKYGIVYTVDSPNNGHFGTWASVLYSGSVLYWGVLVKHLPQGLNNALDTLDSTITHF